jgi:multidrug efflux system membrane fusion protein
LLTLVDLSQVWIEVAVHESQLPQARRAARVTFTTPANPERAYGGRLVAIAGVIDLANRNATAIFAAGNPDHSLKVGMTAEARIPTGSRVRAVLVPASAVLSDEGQSFVYVETVPAVFRRRAVTTGARDGDQLAVTSGLNPNEKVITVGAQSLRGETFRGQLSTEPEGERK